MFPNVKGDPYCPNSIITEISSNEEGSLLIKCYNLYYFHYFVVLMELLINEELKLLFVRVNGASYYKNSKLTTFSRIKNAPF